MSDSPDEPIVREPMFEGLFYPAEKKELAELIQKLLDDCPPDAGSDLVLSPCASLEYAGDLIARAISCLKPLNPERIILLGSAEPAWENSGPAIWLPESSSFRTPLYESCVDESFLNTLMEMSTLFHRNDVPHLETYRLEVQLPFIHALFPQASLVPILVSGCTEGLVKALLGGLQMSSMDHPAREATVVCGNMSGFSLPSKSSAEAAITLDCIQKKDLKTLLKGADMENESRNMSAYFLAASRKRSIQILLQKSSTIEPEFLVSSDHSIEYAALAAR